MFRALQHRNFRLLWFGQVGHATSMWMEQVVRPLLALYLTGSAFQVGSVVAVRLFPILLLGLVAGVLADRYNKRRILLYSQTIIMLMHLALGVLILSGGVEMWHVYLTAFISGGAMAFNQPTRQVILPRLVPRADLLNAIALNQTALSSMRVVGAGLAGLLLIFLDFGEIYLLNGLIYFWVIVTTLQMVVPADEAPRKKRVSFSADLLEGFQYVGRHPQVMYLVATALILFVFGLPFQHVFVPLLAIDELGIGRSGVGGLLAATGVGAITASLLVASRNRIRRRQQVMIGALVVFSLALLVLAHSYWLALSIGALLLTGGMSVVYHTLNSSLLLEQTPPEFHGRVMSLLALDRGLIPIGALIAGALAEAFGPRIGLTVMGLICLSLCMLALFFSRRFRRAGSTSPV
jgi:MFS family permease